MRSCLKMLLPLALPWLALAPAWGQTPVFNAVKDFRITSNPNGQWYYYAVGSYGQLLQNSDSSLNGVPGWVAWLSDHHPPRRVEFARNETHKVIRYNSIVAPVNELLINPENKRSASVVFMVRQHGLYRIDAEFQAISKRPASHVVSILLKKNRFVLSTTLSAYGQTAEYHHYITLDRNQEVAFNVSSAIGSSPPEANATGLLAKIRGPVEKTE